MCLSYGDFAALLPSSPVVYVGVTSLSLVGGVPMEGQRVIPLGAPQGLTQSLV